MDILGPLGGIKCGKRSIIVIMNRHSKLTCSIPMNERTTPLIDACFLINWIFPCWIKNLILTEKGQQFIAQCFRYVWETFGIRSLQITAYHPLSNGKTEQYNKSVSDRFRFFIIYPITIYTVMYRCKSLSFSIIQNCGRLLELRRSLFW